LPWPNLAKHIIALTGYADMGHGFSQNKRELNVFQSSMKRPSFCKAQKDRTCTGILSFVPCNAFWASETFLKDVEGGNQKPIRMGYGRTVFEGKKVQPNPLRIVFPLSSHC
jgi:hypothetical protein